jgi:hypothetical protein
MIGLDRDPGKPPPRRLDASRKLAVPALHSRDQQPAGTKHL